jgi:hypothetical protein
MNQKIVNFGIELPLECFSYDEYRSRGCINYYKIKKYGDWLYGQFTHLKVEHKNDMFNYELGSFDKENKFIAILYWHANDYYHSILDVEG